MPRAIRWSRVRFTLVRLSLLPGKSWTGATAATKTRQGHTEPGAERFRLPQAEEEEAAAADTKIQAEKEKRATEREEAQAAGKRQQSVANAASKASSDAQNMRMLPAGLA